MKTLRQYARIWALLVIGSLAGVGGFNLFVDPYAMFRLVEVQGINANKPLLERHARLHKAYAVRYVKPDAIILGSSRAEVGLDPEGANWAPDVEQPYNLALSSANIYEILRYFQHAQAFRPLKQVVIGLDFFMFNVNKDVGQGFREERFLVTKFGDRHYGSAVEIPKILLSQDASKASLATLRQQVQQSTIAKSGLRPDEVMQAGNQQGYHTRFVESEEGYVENTYKNFALYNNDGHSPTLETFRQIVRQARENKVDLRLFISPSHARQWELIRAMGLWPVFEQWKSELVEILEEDARKFRGQQPYVVWDFSGYNAFSTERVPDTVDASMQWYWDSSHYTKKLGEIVLAHVLSQTQDPNTSVALGTVLQRDTLEETLAQIRSAQLTYAGSYPEDVKEVDRLVGTCH